MFDIRTKKTILLYLLILLVTLCFASYGGVSEFNANLSRGFMRNVYEMWMPSFPMLPMGWNYVLFIPYCILMFYFIRKIRILSFEFIICLTFTIIYGFIYAQPRFREPLMPIIFLWLALKSDSKFR